MDEDKNSQLPVIKNITVLVLVAVLAVTTFWAGTMVGSGANDKAAVSGLINKEVGKPDGVDFSPFWRAWNIVNERHVNGLEIDDQDKVWGAIQGLMRSLDDPHSAFLNPEESDSFSESLKGQFEGVGMEIGLRDDILTVISPIRNSPAFRAGIQAGDLVIEIDGQSTRGISLSKAVSDIRGEKGTEVELTIVREGEDEPLVISIVRDVIDIPILEAGLDDSGVFVIEVFSFTGGVDVMFRQALAEFNSSGSRQLILDLRDNPGGILNSAVEMASHFLPQGAIVVEESYIDEKQNKTHRSRGYGTVPSDVDVVVLVNAGSASASEIVAGALRDHGVATVIGSQTFGKGSIQDLIPLTSETMIKITIAKWLTPDGHSFEGEGIEPDLEVERSRDDRVEGVDPQLEAAFDFLLQN